MGKRDEIAQLRTELAQARALIVELLALPDAEKPASKLRQLRARRGMSQRDLAEALGMKQSAVSMIETGHRSIPWRAVQKLYSVFGDEFTVLLKTDDLTNSVPQSPGKVK